MSTGTIDEKIYTRQLSKEGLQSRVVDNESEVNSISTRSLKELFYYQVIVMACVRACVCACMRYFVSLSMFCNTRFTERHHLGDPRDASV